MKVALSLLCVAGAVSANTVLLDRNLVYRSPLVSHPQLSHDTREIRDRHIEHLKKRQTVNNDFTDDAYPTFYGADFSNAPFVWSGGINFTHSVASGDPLNSSLLVWTRAEPLHNETGTGPSPESVPVCVSYSIFDNDSLEGTPIDTAQAFTSFDVDFTVKLEATGLQPDTKYWFQFADCANPSSVSPVGQTRTLASPDTPADQVNGGNDLTIAVFSCSQYQQGYFNAYNFASHNTSADIFVHLGDYIYESIGNGASIGRKTLGRELATIHDYRQRLGQYRTDVGLIAAHQNAPWITVWDDHEVADQSWKAGTADSNDSAIGCSFSASGACFTDRKQAAVRAYHEWLPVRQVDADDKLRIWRNFQIGQLLDLTMLDTRQYDRDVTDLYYNTDYVNTVSSFANRSLMGFEQENWFFDALSESQTRGAIWRIVGQQIVFTQLNESGVFDLDAWDGYRANRQRVLNYLYENGINNTIILSGDSHANWASDLAHPNDTSYDPITGANAAGVEFAGTAVTSGSSFGTNISPEAADVISRGLVVAPSNEELQWSEGSYRGFFTITMNTTTLTATYYAMNNTNSSNLDGFASAQFVVQTNENKIQRPVAGGSVLAGVLKSTEFNATNASTTTITF